MKLPVEFMADANIRAALITLVNAVETSLKVRGADLKSMVVVVKPSDMGLASALIGCDCELCKEALLKAMAQVCTGEARGRYLEPIFGNNAGPIKGVH